MPPDTQDEPLRERIETTICKRPLFFAWGVELESKERLLSRVMFGTMAGVGKPETGQTG